MAEDNPYNLHFSADALYRLGLTDQPFVDTAPPFEDTARVTQLNVALSLLLSGERIVLVSGEEGLGKSTFLRRLDERQPPGLGAARLLATSQTSAETVWGALGVAVEGSTPSAEVLTRTQAAHHIRGARRGGLRPALLIDDAHSLPPLLFSELMELWETLDQSGDGFALALSIDPNRTPPWAQADARTLPEGRFHTTHLFAYTEQQTAAYLEHYLTSAGAEPELLSAAEKQAVFDASEGHPRRIQQEAFRLLSARLASRTDNLPTASSPSAPSAVKRRRSLTQGVLLSAGAGAMLAAGGSLWFAFTHLDPTAPDSTPTLEISAEEIVAARSTQPVDIDSARSTESALDPSSPPPFGLKLPSRYSFRDEESERAGSSNDRQPEGATDPSSEQLPLLNRPHSPLTQAMAGPPEEPTGSSVPEESETSTQPPTPPAEPAAETAVSSAAVPEAVEPESAEPQTAERETAEPEEADSEAAEPETTEPAEAAEAEPEAAEPEAAAAEPKGAEPEGAAEPEAAAAESQAAEQPADRGEEGALRWVLGQESNRFTLQLLAATERNPLQAYAQQHALGESAHVVTTLRNGEPWYVLLYGSYADRASARQALEELPAAVRQFGPWSRTFASLQAQLAL